MTRTPEGTFFAAAIAITYANREWEKAETAYKHDSSNKKALVRGAFVSTAYEELDKLSHRLADEVIYAEEKVDIASFGKAIAEYMSQPTIDNATLYVAHKVIEDYVHERTATPEATEDFAKDYRMSAILHKHEMTLEPELLREGVIFLREEVETKLQPGELDVANTALE